MAMQRRMVVMCIALLAFALAQGIAQPAPKRLLVINSQDTDPYLSVSAAMLFRLSEHGFDEARGTLIVKTYSMGNNQDFIRRVKKQEGEALYDWDLIVTNGTVASMGAKYAWSEDPRLRFYFVTVTDPVGLGLIGSLDSPPDRNFTGVAYPVPVEERLRFLRKVFPSARRIGYIWGDMPQSASYNEWLAAALSKPEFKDLVLVSREVPFVSGETGTLRMCLDAAALAVALDDEVDVFLAPNDQMGINLEFTRQLSRAITKPLIGLSEVQVRTGNGADMAIYSSHKSIGSLAAEDIASYFSGASFESILPSRPEYDIAINASLVAKHGITIPPEYTKKVR